MLMQIFLLVLFVALNVVGASSETAPSVSWFCSMQQEWCALSSTNQILIIALVIAAIVWIIWRWIKGDNCNCKCSDNQDTVHKL